MYAKRRVYTFEEFIKYRNILLIRQKARKKTFPEDKGRLSYYDIRINEINETYPEFARLGKIEIKDKASRD